MSPMPAPPPLSEPALKIDICRGPEDLANHAAGLFVSLAGRALGARGRFSVALSGGSTPRRTYEQLRQQHYAFQVVWPAVSVHFSDERCVAPDHPDSNFGMAREALLRHVGIPETGIHRMAGESADPEEAAAAYERDLRASLPEEGRLDLLLLGLGADGHTASLFPGSRALAEDRRLASATQAPDGGGRLTLTLPAINAARVVLVLASGEGKAGIVRRVLGAGAVDEGLPIQKVKPRDGRVIWLLDEAAASLIDPPAGA